MLKFSLFTLGLIVTICFGTASAGVIYQEKFNSDGTTGELRSNTGWRVHTSETWAYAKELGIAGANGCVLSASGGDHPEFGLSVNSNPLVPDPAPGYPYLGRSGSFLFWTEEYTISGVDISDLIVSYSHRMTDTQQIRVALRIEDAWFATNAAAITSNDVNFAASGDREAVSVTDASWNSMTFVENVDLFIDDPVASLPTGDITAFGIYADDTASGAVRIDTYTIEPIPEPATVCMLGFGALALIRRRNA